MDDLRTINWCASRDEFLRLDVPDEDLSGLLSRRRVQSTVNRGSPVDQTIVIGKISYALLFHDVSMDVILPCLRIEESECAPELAIVGDGADGDEITRHLHMPRAVLSGLLSSQGEEMTRIVSPGPFLVGFSSVNHCFGVCGDDCLRVVSDDGIGLFRPIQLLNFPGFSAHPRHDSWTKIGPDINVAVSTLSNRHGRYRRAESFQFQQFARSRC